MADSVVFTVGAEARAPQRGSDDIVQGRPASITVSGGTVWLSAPNAAGCAGPASGRLQARLALPTVNGNTVTLVNVQAVGPSVFADYGAAGADMLIRMRRPARCRG